MKAAGSSHLSASRQKKTATTPGADRQAELMQNNPPCLKESSALLPQNDQKEITNRSAEN